MIARYGSCNTLREGKSRSSARRVENVDSLHLAAAWGILIPFVASAVLFFFYLIWRHTLPVVSICRLFCFPSRSHSVVRYPGQKYPGLPTQLICGLLEGSPSPSSRNILGFSNERKHSLRPTLMGTKNLYENGPNLFFLYFLLFFQSYGNESSPDS